MSPWRTIWKEHFQHAENNAPLVGASIGGVSGGCIVLLQVCDYTLTFSCQGLFFKSESSTQSYADILWIVKPIISWIWVMWHRINAGVQYLWMNSSCMLCPCICLACVACYLLTSACVCARVYMLSYICAHVPACGGEAQSPVPVDKEQAPISLSSSSLVGR